MLYVLRSSATEWQPHTSIAFRYDTSLACGYVLRSATCRTYALVERQLTTTGLQLSTPGPVWQLDVVDYMLLARTLRA